MRVQIKFDFDIICQADLNFSDKFAKSSQYQDYMGKDTFIRAGIMEARSVSQISAHLVKSKV